MSGNKSGKLRYGMVIDLDKCTGCMTCAVACQQENNVPFREDETNKVRSITWLVLCITSVPTTVLLVELSYHFGI